MKSPWDKDPGTVVIKNDEVTEQWDLDAYLEEQRKLARLKKKQPQKKVEEKKPEKKEKKKIAEPDPEVSKKEIRGALDDTIKKLSDTSTQDEFTEIVESTDLKTLQGADVGQILINTTHLTPEQLEEAYQIRREQSGQGETLGDILVRKKYVTDAEFLNALSLQLNIPILDQLIKEEMDPELAKKVPINFCKKHNLVPLRKERNAVIVAVANGADLSPIDDIRILLKTDVKPMLAKKSEITDAINRIYDRASASHEDLMQDLEEDGIDSMDLNETQDLLDSEDEAPIIRLVNTLLFRAVKERASDIHIEAFEKDLSVRFRIDGVLYEIMKPPKRAQASISSRIKIMADLDIAEKRIPQDGRIKIKIAGRNVDIRVSTLPTAHGERIVMRLLDTSNILLDLADIGFSKPQLNQMEKIIHKSHGIFLVTGPTGSGKTTTLYACLSRINSRERNIITVEDPVEIQLGGIGQIQVNPKVNLTFASGLRSILRQDPDVIMVGEIRDLETAEIAIQASLTGHLVFSTLHTNDAASAITRLVDMGVEPFLVSSSLVAVMAQRLVRRVCKECREPYKPEPQEFQELSINPNDAANATIYRAKGCAVCTNTGYLGRTGIYEVFPIDEDLRAAILKNADGNTLKKIATGKGMKSLRDDGAHKILSGHTTIEEVLRVTQEDMNFD